MHKINENQVHWSQVEAYIFKSVLFIFQYIFFIYNGYKLYYAVNQNNEMEVLTRKYAGGLSLKEWH